MATMEYHEWVDLGVEKGWIEPPDCIHHGAKDPIPWTDEESDRIESGDDPCIVAARFWGPEGKPPP